MKDKIDELTNTLGKLKTLKKGILLDLDKEITDTNSLLERAIEKAGQKVEPENLKDFIKQPYVMIPAGNQQWYVAVPKIFRWQIGWLDHATPSYNIFRVNKFMKWLGDIPEELEKKFKFKEDMPITIVNGTLHTGEALQDRLFERYKKHLTRREGKAAIRIKKGREFDLIAQIIDDGTLPFNPIPVEKEDLRKYELSFKLRDYQQDGWDKFLDTGAIGIFWPPSTGKTYLGLKAISNLKGRKVVIVPTLTLKEQWEDRIKEFTDQEYEVDVETYFSFHKVKDEEYTLAIYDECHHLPANTFSRLSTVRAKYRMGLSATPYREDGRTQYIFALTGFPIGLSWDNLIEMGVIEKPDVRIYLFSHWQEKEKKLEELVGEDKKTLIFCDSINSGKRISKNLDIPFVYGETSKRTEIIKDNPIVIVSRVGDEGISIPDIERTIEIDFLYGSRRQEGQRLGRLFHGVEAGEHIILMTNAEFEKYQKRLYAITEKGFKIEIIQ